MGTPLDVSLADIRDFPYTLSFCIRKAKQIDSFFELPKDKRPPESIWDNSQELKIWYENLAENKQTQMDIDLGEIEG